MSYAGAVRFDNVARAFDGLVCVFLALPIVLLLAGDGAERRRRAATELLVILLVSPPRAESGRRERLLPRALIFANSGDRLPVGLVRVDPLNITLLPF